MMPGSSAQRRGRVFAPPPPTPPSGSWPSARFRSHDSAHPGGVQPTLDESENIAYVRGAPSLGSNILHRRGHSSENTFAIAKNRDPMSSSCTRMPGKGSDLRWCRAATETSWCCSSPTARPIPRDPALRHCLPPGRFAKGLGHGPGRQRESPGSHRRHRACRLSTFVRRKSPTSATVTSLLAPPLPADLSTRRDGFDVEALRGAHALRRTCFVEVPSFETPRLHGTSKLSARRDGIRIVRTIIAEWLRP